MPLFRSLWGRPLRGRPLWALLLITLFGAPVPFDSIQAKDKHTEADYNKIYCDLIGGKTEVRHVYTTDAGETGFIIVDCETATEVIEGGLDKRSSLDSIQQALFFGYLTGKKPVIVIYDTDGIEGKIEYRLRIVTKLTGIAFTIFPD